MKLMKNRFGSYFFYPCKNNEEKKGIIIFIHGFATTSEYHDSFIKYVNDKYDYYALQLPGHGHEEDASSKRTMDLDKYTKYCVDLIRSLNVGKFYLIGHSMGGGLGVRVANILEKHVLAFVAATPMNSRLPVYSIFNYFKFTPSNFKKTLNLNNRLYKDLRATTEQYHNDLEQFINNETEYQLKHRSYFVKLKKSMFSLKNIQKCRANEKKLQVPTLAIAGKYDKMIYPKSVLKAFKTKQKNKEFIQFELFENSAHIPFQEEEEKYANSILTFFDSYSLKK